MRRIARVGVLSVAPHSGAAPGGAVMSCIDAEVVFGA
jgi:hypothetical protein